MWFNEIGSDKSAHPSAALTSAYTDRNYDCICHGDFRANGRSVVEAGCRTVFVESLKPSGMH